MNNPESTKVENTDRDANQEPEFANVGTWLNRTFKALGTSYECVTSEPTGSVETNLRVVRNLKRLAARLHLMASLIHEADQHLDATRIATVALMLRHERATLPTTLQLQLDAAHACLPFGLLVGRTPDYCDVFMAVEIALYPTSKNGKPPHEPKFACRCDTATYENSGSWVQCAPSSGEFSPQSNDSIRVLPHRNVAAPANENDNGIKYSNRFTEAQRHHTGNS